MWGNYQPYMTEDQKCLSIDKDGDVRVTSDAKEALQQKFNKEALRDKYKS